VGTEHDYFPNLHRLIYFSRARPETIAEMDAVFPEILRRAMQRNSDAGITGSLLACDGWFLQALEGPMMKVLRVFGRIRNDRRHEGITVIKAEPIETRAFASSNMCGRHLSPGDDAIVSTLESHHAFEPAKPTPASALNLLHIVRMLQSQAGRRILEPAQAAGAAPAESCSET
jgi:hypothetical protein